MESDITNFVEECGKSLPRFEDGRIDYTDSEIAPVLSLFVVHNNKLLILKRSDSVSTYQKIWSGVGGYLDDMNPVENKIHEELREELSIASEQITKITPLSCYDFKDDYKKWKIWSFIVEINTSEIKLDWEHTEYEWIDVEEISKFKIIPSILNDLDKLKEFLNKLS